MDQFHSLTSTSNSSKVLRVADIPGLILGTLVQLNYTAH